MGSNPIGATNQNPLHCKGVCAFRGRALAGLGPRTLAAMASSRVAVCSSMPSMRCPYRSIVTWMQEWPSRVWIAFGCSPSAMS